MPETPRSKELERKAYQCDTGVRFAMAMELAEQLECELAEQSFRDPTIGAQIDSMAKRLYAAAQIGMDEYAILRELARKLGHSE